MAQNQRGEPVYSVRIPRHIVEALQTMATDQQTTSSAIIRELVRTELIRNGYYTTAKPVEGQVKISEIE